MPSPIIALDVTLLKYFDYINRYGARGIPRSYGVRDIQRSYGVMSIQFTMKFS